MSYENLRFFVYARKSSEGEDRQVQSLPDQSSVLDTVIGRDHLTIIDQYAESKSAKTPYRRPGFIEMIERIVRGEGDAILCWHVNRLARNPVEGGQVIYLLQTGVIKCIKTPDRLYLPEDNMLALSVEFGMANQYSLDLGKDIKRGRQEKAARGWWPYGTPLGYRINPETREWEPHPERFPLLRRAWELMLTGSYTVPQVWQELNGWGLRVKKKGSGIGEIALSSLYRHFEKPFYYGVFPYQGGLEQGKHQPLVSREEFDQVQRILHRPNHVQPQKYEFPFTCLIRCAKCGCVITAEKKYKQSRATGELREYTYYHCTGRRGCVRKSVKAQDLEATLTLFVRTCHLSYKVADWVSNALDRDAMTEPAALEAIGESQQEELKALEARLETLFDMRERGEISSEEFVERKNRVRTKIAALREAMTEQKRQYLAALRAVQVRLKEAPTAYERFTNGSDHDKRQIASLVADSYILDNGVLSISAHPLFDVIRTFEPLLEGAQRVGSGSSMPSDSVLRSFLENIRKIIREEDVCKSPVILRTHLNYVHQKRSNGPANT